MLFSIEGLVLSKEKVGEIDLLVETLTPKGKVWAIAKGAQKSKRRFVNLLEDFNLLTLHLRRNFKGTLPILEKADLLFIPESLWEDLEKYVFFSYLGEVLSKVSFKGLEVEYFNFIKDWIKFLDKEPKITLWHKVFFEWQMLGFLGWSPQVEGCVKCGYQPKRIFYFSVRDGGVLCYRCKEENAFRLTLEQVEVLKIFSKMSKKPKFLKEPMKKKRLSSEVLMILNKISERFFQYFLVFDVISLKMVKETLGMEVVS